MRKLNLFRGLTLTLAIASIASPLQAQGFKKFKEKTKFGKSKNARPASSLLEKAEANTGSATTPNIFGRTSGDNNSGLPARDKKYLNVNPETAFGPDVVTAFNFENKSLVELTKFMQELIGINLILDKDLKGKVTILAPTPITVGEAWKAYLTALNINGYTLVKSGAFYKIVNARDIRYTPTKIYTGNYTPSTENYVMRIIPLKNINSTEVTRSFRPFMSRYGRIIDIKQTNTIIVQDTGSNINRLVRLIRFVDVPGHEESLQIIKVRHTSAQEIAKLLDQILKAGTSKFRGSKGGAASSGKGSKNISKIIAEPRTNAIIAMANAEGAKQLRSLIGKLDVKNVTGRSGQIHVYYLNHGDAETLAKTLSALVGSTAAPKRSSSRKSSSSRFSSQSSTASLFASPVKITADKDNNALVVTASPTDYLTIKNVITKLDIPRDQVYVEGLIMETQISRTNNVGVSFIGAYGAGNASRAGFTGGSGDLASLLGGGTGIVNIGGFFAGGGIGNEVTLPGPNGDVTVNTINGLVSALARNGNANVLATPQILALDNTEATFEVGETVPTPERRSETNGSSTVSVTQQKVALTLKITPQINKVTRFVKLKIDQKIDDFSTRPLAVGNQSGGVGTTTRQAVTTVVVRDRDTIAMGGLMRDKEEVSIDKVPLLGDIPVLGWLFRNKTERTEKVNLLFFLTPKILASYESTAANTVKDLLNRRGAHLKKEVGENDPFGSTVRGLYEKAKKQDDGPLYDVEEASKFKRQNDGPGIGNDRNNDDDQASLQVPNYNSIVQQINSRASGLKKKKK